MAIIGLLIWIGSLISGWIGFLSWLAVPGVVYLIYVIVAHKQAMDMFLSNGMSGDVFGRSMLSSNVRLVVWNIAVKSVLFGVGALAATFF
jgi:hypothetical protein